MTTLQSVENQNTEGFWNFGDYQHKDSETFLQEAGRVADLVKYTAVARQQSSLSLVPVSELNPDVTSASLECAVNGGLIAAYQNADSEFAINVDGEGLINIQVDMTAIVALTDIAPAINTISVPLGVFCSYNEETNTFYFSSLKKGLPGSSITALTAVAGGAGTDISGATHLNGLAAAAITITAATGEASTAIPIGIFIGDDIATADLVAGDVIDQYVAISGDPAGFDVDKLVLEGGLSIDDIVVSTGQSIRQHLINIGLIASTTDEILQTTPLT